MNNYIQNIDWSNTPFGSIEKWPQALYSFVNICYNSNAPAFICWEDDLIFVCNDEWSDLMENESGSLLGKPAREVWAEDWPFFKTNFQVVLSTGEVREVENKQISLPSGEEQWFSFSFSPIVDGTGMTRGIFTIARKFIPNSFNEKELPQGEQKLADFFENAPIGIHWLGPDGTILKVNQTELDMLGYSREEFVGRNITEFYVDENLIKSAVQQLIEGKELYNCEGSMICKDGSIRHILLSSNVYRKSGEFIHTRCFTLDITERKRAQQELQSLNENLEKRVEERTKTLKGYQDYLRKLVGQLSEVEEQERHRLAAQLHDNLGQILTICKMKVNRLQDEQPPDKKTNGLQELKELIDDALSYTRGLMSDLKPLPTLDEQDLRASIKWVADKMTKHDLDVTIKDDGKPKKTRKEVRTVLVQSVRELLFNVIKHANVDKAFISMSRKNDQVEIIISDKGEGFDPSSLGKTDSEEGGFGLHHLQERMVVLGGSTDITSEPGKGTEVTLRAPLVDEKELDSTRDREERTPSTVELSKEKISVLLVEDHKKMREGLCKIVNTKEDMEVIGEAVDGKEAVELARETTPDVVIMDVNLPDMNGIETTKKIKYILPTVRIIGISFHDDLDVMENMRKAGATAFVKKDEAYETLCKTIREEISASD